MSKSHINSLIPFDKIGGLGDYYEALLTINSVIKTTEQLGMTGDTYKELLRIRSILEAKITVRVRAAEANRFIYNLELLMGMVNR